MNQKKVAIYARTLSKKENSKVLNDQLKKLRQYAKDNNLEVVSEYHERLIDSMFYRPALDKLLIDGRNGLFNTMLITSYKRIVMVDNPPIEELNDKFKAMGLEIITCE